MFKMPTTEAEEALIKAAKQGDLATLTRLLEEKGVNVNASDMYHRTALMWAADNGKLDCLDYLIAKGANLEATQGDGCTAFMLAAGCSGGNKHGKLDCLDHLIAKGANVNATWGYGWTALMGAAQNGKLDLLEHLIAKGADVNAQCNDKATALHGAAFSGHAPCVESLLKAGADASLKEDRGYTAFDQPPDYGDD